MKLKVKSDEVLFRKWKKLRENLDQSLKNLPAIIQNDMEISEDTVKAWKELVKKVKKEFDDDFRAIVTDTLTHIRKCNG